MYTRVYNVTFGLLSQAAYCQSECISEELLLQFAFTFNSSVVNCASAYNADERPAAAAAAAAANHRPRTRKLFIGQQYTHQRSPYT